MDRVDGKAARERQTRREGAEAGPSSGRTVGRPRLAALTTGTTLEPPSPAYHNLPAPRSISNGVKTVDFETERLVRIIRPGTSEDTLSRE